MAKAVLAPADIEQGTKGAGIEVDAVEFCRVLSGRAPGEGLIATRIVF
jgi:hypothetical protein